MELRSIVMYLVLTGILVKTKKGLLTEVKIPADDDEEAYARLEGLLGSACEHFRLNDVRDY